MKVIVVSIADSVIRKTSLPDFCVGSKFLLRPIRKSAFDHLDGALEGNRRRDQKMKMIRHKNKVVKEIGLAAVRKKILEKEPCPQVGLK
jgi:hypothetical protein